MLPAALLAFQGTSLLAAVLGLPASAWLALLEGSTRRPEARHVKFVSHVKRVCGAEVAARKKGGRRQAVATHAPLGSSRQLGSRALPVTAARTAAWPAPKDMYALDAEGPASGSASHAQVAHFSYPIHRNPAELVVLALWSAKELAVAANSLEFVPCAIQASTKSMV